MPQYSNSVGTYSDNCNTFAGAEKPKPPEVTAALESLADTVKRIDNSISLLSQRCVRVVRSEPVARCDEVKAAPHSSVPLAQEIWALRDILAEQNDRLALLLDLIEV